MTKNGTTLTYRVTQLEKCTERHSAKLDMIMENHLPHIQQGVERNNTLIKAATVINVGAIILAAVILDHI